MEMGGSTSKKVSFGLDENEKVIVIEGVKVDITSTNLFAIQRQSLSYSMRHDDCS